MRASLFAVRDVFMNSAWRGIHTLALLCGLVSPSQLALACAAAAASSKSAGDHSHKFQTGGIHTVCCSSSCSTATAVKQHSNVEWVAQACTMWNGPMAIGPLHVAHARACATLNCACCSLQSHQHDAVLAGNRPIPHCTCPGMCNPQLCMLQSAVAPARHSAGSWHHSASWLCSTGDLWKIPNCELLQARRPPALCLCALVQWSGNLARQRLVLAPARQLAGWQQLANCSATCFFSAACAASGNCCQCGAIFSCCRHQLVLAAAAATAAASGMHQVVHTAVMPVQQHWQLVAQHWQ